MMSFRGERDNGILFGPFLEGEHDERVSAVDIWERLPRMVWEYSLNGCSVCVSGVQRRAALAKVPFLDGDVGNGSIQAYSCERPW
jgi:hypothetical protein